MEHGGVEAERGQPNLAGSRASGGLGEGGQDRMKMYK